MLSLERAAARASVRVIYALSVSSVCLLFGLGPGDFMIRLTPRHTPEVLLKPFRAQVIQYTRVLLPPANH